MFALARPRSALAPCAQRSHNVVVPLSLVTMSAQANAEAGNSSLCGCGDASGAFVLNQHGVAFGARHDSEKADANTEDKNRRGCGGKQRRRGCGGQQRGRSRTVRSRKPASVGDNSSAGSSKETDGSKSSAVAETESRPNPDCAAAQSISSSESDSEERSTTTKSEDESGAGEGMRTARGSVGDQTREEEGSASATPANTASSAAAENVPSAVAETAESTASSAVAETPAGSDSAAAEKPASSDEEESGKNHEMEVDYEGDDAAKALGPAAPGTPADSRTSDMMDTEKIKVDPGAEVSEDGQASSAVAESSEPPIPPNPLLEKMKLQLNKHHVIGMQAMASDKTWALKSALVHAPLNSVLCGLENEAMMHVRKEHMGQEEERTWTFGSRKGINGMNIFCMVDEMVTGLEVKAGRRWEPQGDSRGTRKAQRPPAVAGEDKPGMAAAMFQVTFGHKIFAWSQIRVAVIQLDMHGTSVPAAQMEGLLEFLSDWEATYAYVVASGSNAYGNFCVRLVKGFDRAFEYPATVVAIDPVEDKRITKTQAMIAIGQLRSMRGPCIPTRLRSHKVYLQMRNMAEARQAERWTHRHEDSLLLPPCQSKLYKAKRHGGMAVEVEEKPYELLQLLMGGDTKELKVRKQAVRDRSKRILKRKATVLKPNAAALKRRATTGSEAPSSSSAAASSTAAAIPSAAAESSLAAAGHPKGKDKVDPIGAKKVKSDRCPKGKKKGSGGGKGKGTKFAKWSGKGGKVKMESLTSPPAPKIGSTAVAVIGAGYGTSSSSSGRPILPPPPPPPPPPPAATVPPAAVAHRVRHRGPVGVRHSSAVAEHGAYYPRTRAVAAPQRSSSKGKSSGMGKAVGKGSSRGLALEAGKGRSTAAAVHSERHGRGKGKGYSTAAAVNPNRRAMSAPPSGKGKHGGKHHAPRSYSSGAMFRREW